MGANDGDHGKKETRSKGALAAKRGWDRRTPGGIVCGDTMLPLYDMIIPSQNRQHHHHDPPPVLGRSRRQGRWTTPVLWFLFPPKFRGSCRTGSGPANHQPRHAPGMHPPRSRFFRPDVRFGRGREPAAERTRHGSDRSTGGARSYQLALGRTRLRVLEGESFGVRQRVAAGQAGTT